MVVAPQYIVIMDFEATCDDGPSRNRADKCRKTTQEIIEWPAVILNVNTLEIEAEFHRYVRPTDVPLLTKFCTQLTGIRQTQVARAATLEPTLHDFHHFLCDFGLLGTPKDTWSFVLCGDWDLKTMLPTECSRKCIKIPKYFKSWMNIKHIFQAHYQTKKTVGNGRNAIILEYAVSW